MDRERIRNYITNLFADQDSALLRAGEEAIDKGLPPWGITPEEGRFLQFLVRTSGASKAVEIGSLGGYSGIWITRGLLPGGKLITLERDPNHARVARENFTAAGLDDRVEVRIGEARELLNSMSSEGPFDFVFIDADKIGYLDYFAWAAANVYIGGVIAAHNALRGGAVLDGNSSDESTRAVADLNRQVARDGGLISTIYPAGDGTLVAVKVA